MRSDEYLGLPDYFRNAISSYLAWLFSHGIRYNKTNYYIMTGLHISCIAQSAQPVSSHATRCDTITRRFLLKILVTRCVALNVTIDSSHVSPTLAYAIAHFWKRSKFIFNWSFYHFNLYQIYHFFKLNFCRFDYECFYLWSLGFVYGFINVVYCLRRFYLFFSHKRVLCCCKNVDISFVDAILKFKTVTD